MSRKLTLVVIILLFALSLTACDMFNFYFKGELPQAGGTEQTVTALVKELESYKLAGPGKTTEAPLQATVVSITPAFREMTRTLTPTSTATRVTPTLTRTNTSQPVGVSQAVLSIPSLGKTYTGKPISSSMNYSVFFIGHNGDGDWPHCSGSINRVEITPLNGGTPIVEDFSNSAVFKQTGSTVSISGGKVVFNRYARNGGAQFVYRTIPAITGPVRIRVIGQVDWWENNCGIAAGIANSDFNRTGQSTTAYPSIAFGYMGGGCSVSGPLIQAYGTNIGQVAYKSDGCSFTSTGAPWIKSKTPIEAVLEIK